MRALALFLALLFAARAEAGIDFVWSDDLPPREISEDWSVVRYSELDARTRKLYGARFLLREAAAPERGVTLALVCASLTQAGEPRGIQLLSLRDGKPVSRVKLGGGAAPELVLAGGRHLMVTVLRGGSTESVICEIIDGGRLREVFRVSSGMVDRAKLDIKAVLNAGATVDVSSRRLGFSETVDLTAASEALVEDEIYQEGGRPVPSLVNLKCERVGWEGEALTIEEGRPRVSVGLSLLTHSGKPVLTAAVVFGPTEADSRWLPLSMTCGPFMAYREH